MKIMADCMKYQQRMRVASKDGGYKIRYVSRKVEDRKKKGPTDLKGRSLTDLKRETIDLRPDHSRVLQDLVEDGRKEALRPILAEIQAEQIRLFEEVHPGRKVRSLGEHTD